MARRSTEDVLAEFHELSLCFYEMMDILYNHDGSFWTTGNGRWISTEADALRWMEEKKATASELAAGVREALNDVSLGLNDMLVRNPTEARAALDEYEKRRGKSYWTTAGHPKRMLKKLIRRGSLANETEARLLVECLSDVDQKLLAPNELAIANEMLSAFESHSAT